jgi:hypothetical protein
MGSIASHRAVRDAPGMSAMPPIATQSVRRNEVSRCANSYLIRCSEKTPLLDHLVGAGEKGFRNRKTCEIDHLNPCAVQFRPIAGRGRPVLSRIINSKKPAKTAARGSANIQNSVAGKMCPKEFR